MSAIFRVSPGEAARIAYRHYGRAGRAERLAAEHDDTFRLTAADGSAVLLKISLPDEQADAGTGGVSLPTAVLLHLAAAAPGLPVQRLDELPDGGLLPEVAGAAGAGRVAGAGRL